MTQEITLERAAEDKELVKKIGALSSLLTNVPESIEDYINNLPVTGAE